MQFQQLFSLSAGLLLALSVGCGGDGKTTETKSEAPKKETKKEAKKQKKKEKKKKSDGGLKAKSNNAEVVKLAEAALKCEWSSSGPKYKCEAYKAWREAAQLKKGANDATLVSFLADKDEKVRWLGARKLSASYGGKGFQSDKDLAASIIEAAQNEKSKLVVSNLGSAVARINGEKTGQTETIKKMILEHSDKEMRYTIARSFISYNKNDANYRFVLDQARSNKDNKLKDSLASSLWVGTPTGKWKESCTLWMEHAKSGVKDLAGNGANRVAMAPTAYSGGCATFYDELLTLVEGNATAGKVQSNSISYAMSYIQGQKKATPEQKAKALDIAKKIVSNEKNADMARSSALRVVGEYDATAKEFAKQYTETKAFFVKSTAKDIMSGKIKLKEKKK